MKQRRPQAEQGGATARAAALRDAFRQAGGASAIDYLHQQMSVGEAAVFLGTTKGQLYNLLNRREMSYYQKLWIETA